MNKKKQYPHPNMFLYKFQQIALLLLLIVQGFASFLLIIAGFFLPAPLFFVMSILVILIAAPVLMAMVNTPPVTLTDQGIVLEPFIGGERLIPWQAIDRIEVYPLLPQADQEILKQYLIGRKKYRAAEGIMLIVPSLPFPYRIAGTLAGAKGQAIIALTNRSHQDYPNLKQGILQNAPHAIESLLIEE